MSISSVSSVSFKGNSQSTQRPKGGAGKAAITWFIPGLGEFLDGRNKEGALFLGSRLGVGALTGVLYTGFAKNILNAFANGASSFKGDKIIPAAITLLGLTSFGLAIANTVDAYKGGSDKKIDKQA